MSDLIEGAMSSPFKDALQRFRKFSSASGQNYVSDLFPVGWTYAVEEHPQEESEQIDQPAQVVKASMDVTEKTKVLDSFHEFASQQIEKSNTPGFAFPGGEVRKKADNAALIFNGIKASEMGAEQLKELSAGHSETFGSLKFTSNPKSKIKVLFVAEESSDLALLEGKTLGLEAFYSSEAANLFSRMIQAMKLGEGESFVSSLKIVEGDKVSSFETGLANEIASLKPELLIPLGGAATSAFLGEGTRLQTSHGQFYTKELAIESGDALQFEVMPLFSPAFLVEAPNTKRIAWEDMQKAMKKLGL